MSTVTEAGSPGQSEASPGCVTILQANYGNNEYDLRNAIQDSWGERDDGPFECGI